MARRRRGRMRTRKAPPTLMGTLRVARPGSAVVETSEGTFAVARGGIREGMDGDEVTVALVRRGRGGEPQAVVRGVLARATATFLGTFSWADPLGVVVALDARMRRDFFVLPDDASPARLGVGEGDVVVARILSYPTRVEAGVVMIDRRIGAASELDMDVEAVIASFGLATAFGDAARAEAAACVVDAAGTLAADPDRRDLRGLCVVTVDPADARDFDDAVSACRRDDGGFEVGVHIADVTHYLPWDGHLDVEARARTCSVYLVDRVLPMLPGHLSDDVCSLRPGADRLAMSVHLSLDAHGNVVSARAEKSVIRSAARLTYDEVDALLSGVAGPGSAASCPPAALPGVPGADTASVVDALLVLDEVAHLRARLRARRGAVDFETREAKVTLAPDGTPVGVRVRGRTAATSLVEEAMLMANEAVAGMLAAAGVRAAYRVHERPSPVDMRGAAGVLRELGVLRPGEVEGLAAGVPSVVRAVLARAAGTPAGQAVNTLLLRAQRRAVYLPTNEGHYALGATAYCHFTSPIRRYPDVIVHRALKALLAGAPLPAGPSQALPQLCRDCSDRERVADAAARASQRVKMAELYAGRVGERVAGVVVGVERFGLFVMDDDTCAEGLLPTRSLGDERFSYDRDRMELVGESSGRVWRLGQRVAVEVVGTTPARGQIDFALAGGA